MFFLKAVGKNVHRRCDNVLNIQWKDDIATVIHVYISWHLLEETWSGVRLYMSLSFVPCGSFVTIVSQTEYHWLIVKQTKLLSLFFWLLRGVGWGVGYTQRYNRCTYMGTIHGILQYLKSQAFGLQQFHGAHIQCLDWSRSLSQAFVRI